MISVEETQTVLPSYLLSQLTLIPATLQCLGALLPNLKPGKSDLSQSLQHPRMGPGYSPVVGGRGEMFLPAPLFLPSPPPLSSRLGPETPYFSQEHFCKDLCVLIQKTTIFCINRFDLY